MKLRKIELWSTRAGFRDGPYVMSHITQQALPIRMLRLTAGDDSTGLGEMVRSPRYDAEVCAAMEDEVLRGLDSLALDGLPALAVDLRRRDARLHGLAFGLETAWLDLVGHRVGVPLDALLGGRLGEDAADYLSLGGAAPATMARRTAGEGAGREVIQVKLGDRDIAEDHARIAAVCEAAGPGQRLLMDFNGALDVAGAIAVIRHHGHGDPRLVWEEPCNTVAMNLEVAQATGAPIMFDQCLKSLDLYVQVCARGLDASVCIKPAAPLGGLSVARAARDMAVDAGVPVRIDGPWCGPVGTAAALALALGTPPELLVAGCDLTEPLMLAEDWGPFLARRGSRIAPLDAPGHGIAAPDAARFATVWEA